ncbi:family 16 glycosylhydrolase [Rubellimicrobium roseum]|uniref:family 16 glycosylhydrolase n=1 Tax=Rubellimicrobium roseum TaxID=687525 RepID=UPI00159BE856|nr:family 16 glycosylhydrolase [Rubellimicrobium roseum]
MRPAPDGRIELHLGPAPPDADRLRQGGEVQSCAVAAEGLWEWEAQAPALVPGAVFGLFAYRADHAAQPWLEFDIEFVGPDTRRARLNIHMQASSAAPVTLEAARGGPVLAELGFDAARGLHRYGIAVTGREVVFTADGRVLGRFSPSDMPGRLWAGGLLRGFANLWCVDTTLESWAGSWRASGQPR